VPTQNQSKGCCENALDLTVHTLYPLLASCPVWITAKPRFLLVSSIYYYSESWCLAGQNKYASTIISSSALEHLVHTTPRGVREICFGNRRKKYEINITK
jgi:hypothetical protein